VRRTRIIRKSTLAALSLGTALVASRVGRADDTAPPAPSPASSEMLKTMREKGVLTQEEYDELYRRQAVYEAKQRQEQSLPGWLDNWTVGGDFRLRYDIEDWHKGLITPGDPLVPGVNNVNQNTGTAIQRRDQARIRLRIGAEKELSDGLEVGFRIATSQPYVTGAQTSATGPNNQPADFSTALLADPRSENVTLGNFFAPKSIFLDRAYLRWTPSFAKNLRFTAGKVPNPFVSGNFPDLVVWDPDINPEGVTAEYHFDWLAETFWTDTRFGYFFVNEVGSVNVDPTLNPTFSVIPVLDEHDPYMYAVQQSITAQLFPWLRLGGRAAYYDLLNINTKLAAATMELGNTGDAISQNPLYVLLPQSSRFVTNGKSNGRMQEIAIDGYLTWNGLGDRWQLTPFIQWTFMPNAHTLDESYSAGVTFGTAEFLKLTLMWSHVQANGTIALFTDSDLFDGQTDAKGWYLAAERRLNQSLLLRVAYFASQIQKEPCTVAPPHQVLAYCNGGAFTANPTAFAQYSGTNLSRFRVQIDLLADF